MVPSLGDWIGLCQSLTGANWPLSERAGEGGFQ